MRPEVTETRAQNLGKVTVDLLSVPSLVSRIIRKKLFMATLADTEIDLKPSHFEILYTLKDEGTMHPSKIGEKLLIAKAQMTHLIDRVVDLGFVKREIDAVDRRTFNITLTDKGHEWLAEQDKLVVNAVRDVMAELSEKELESLSNSLRTLRDILSKLQ